MIFSDCLLLVPKTAQLQEGSSEQTVNGSRESTQLSIEYNQQSRTIDPIKLRRQVISGLLPKLVSCIVILKAHGVFCLQKLRDERREKRIAELIHMSKETELQMQNAAIERAKEFNNMRRAWYSIWRKEYINPNSDTTLKLMRDQKIMAKVYASVAYSTGERDLYNSLTRHIKEIQRGIGDANSDSELQERYLLVFYDESPIIILGSDARIISLHPVHLNKQKLWAMPYPLQETSYLTAMSLQESYGPCFSLWRKT